MSEEDMKLSDIAAIVTALRVRRESKQYSVNDNKVRILAPITEYVDGKVGYRLGGGTVLGVNKICLNEGDWTYTFWYYPIKVALPDPDQNNGANEYFHRFLLSPKHLVSQQWNFLSCNYNQKTFTVCLNLKTVRSFDVTDVCKKCDSLNGRSLTTRHGLMNDLKFFKHNLSAEELAYIYNPSMVE